MCCVQIPKPQCCTIVVFPQAKFSLPNYQNFSSINFYFFQFITSFGLLINSLFLRIQSCTHQDITSQQSALKSILKVTVAILQPFSLCSGHNKPFLVFNATILRPLQLSSSIPPKSSNHPSIQSLLRVTFMTFQSIFEGASQDYFKFKSRLHHP